MKNGLYHKKANNKIFHAFTRKKSKASTSK